jgi:HSP20 family protein
MTLVKWKKPSEPGLKNNTMLFQSPFVGLLENFLGDEYYPREYAAFMPAVNVSENDNEFLIELSAAGFSKEDFKVVIENGVLRVSAEHKQEEQAKDQRFTRKEFRYGSFVRSFNLPDEIKDDVIDAKYENGILKIKLPKKEEAKPKAPVDIKIS